MMIIIHFDIYPSRKLWNGYQQDMFSVTDEDATEALSNADDFTLTDTTEKERVTVFISLSEM